MTNAKLIDLKTNKEYISHFFLQETERGADESRAKTGVQIIK